jgi:hypothetical protein
MFVLFGLLIAPVVDRLDRKFARVPSDRVGGLYAVGGGLIALVAAQGLFAAHWSWLIVVPLGFALAVAAGERLGAGWTAHRSLVRASGYATLAVPFVAGMIDIGQELTEISAV